MFYKIGPRFVYNTVLKISSILLYCLPHFKSRTKWPKIYYLPIFTRLESKSLIHPGIVIGRNITKSNLRKLKTRKLKMSKVIGKYKFVQKCFFRQNVTREIKLLNLHSYEKSARKMLLKLTPWSNIISFWALQRYILRILKS